MIFILLKDVLKQTSNAHNSKFQPYRKDQKNSCQARPSLGIFLPLTDLIVD